MELFKIYRSYLPDPELKTLRSSVREVPEWLGNFRFMQKTLDRLTFSNDIWHVIEELQALHPTQEFNTLFWQTYREGEFVKKHRDPKNNVGYTLVAILGEPFEGAETTLYLDSGEVKFTLAPGDVLSLACTIDGLQGPYHEVSPVTKGLRHALILNTIVGVELPVTSEKSNNINELFD